MSMIDVEIITREQNSSNRRVSHVTYMWDRPYPACDLVNYRLPHLFRLLFPYIER